MDNNSQENLSRLDTTTFASLPCNPLLLAQKVVPKSIFMEVVFMTQLSKESDSHAKAEKERSLQTGTKIGSVLSALFHHLPGFSEVKRFLKNS
jgi:hypothetical protein